MWKLKIGEGNDPWLKTVSNHLGRQHWEFDPEAGTPEERAEVERLREHFNKNRFHQKQSADLMMRMQLRKENPIRGPFPAAVKVKENEVITEDAVQSTLKRAVSFYCSIQAHDGHWPSELAGSLYFLPPLVMAFYVTGQINVILSLEHQKEMKRYMYNHQNEDGGWGHHANGTSTMFGSSLNYIALRILGEGAEDGENMAMAMGRGRKWILDHGGLVGAPSWAKFWLAVLGVYEWLGVNPVPPEFWLLPTIGPIHPGKMMCYCRLVYMPMSYIYGKRFVGPITKLIQSLREELYTKPYHEINWNKARNTVIKEDLYYPHPTVQDMLWGFLHHVVEPILTYWPFSNLRENALKRAIELVHYEDEASRYLTLGCVEKVLCMLACWIEDPNSEAYKCHLARVPDYYWVAEDGLKIVATPGYPGWDVAFAIQAIISSNLVDEYWPTLRKAHDFLKASQIQEDPPGNFSERYRHITKGSWSFATKDHGWQSCDTTAEALKATLLLSQMPQELVGEKMDANHFYDAVNVLLYLQSANGGFPAWEPQRAFRWLEKFNPTEFIQDVIIEAEYVELTSSVLQSLVLFRKLYPTHRTNEIESCIKNAIHYIEETQNPDGSWYGNWGICYTYGTMFAIEALNCCGKNYQNSFAMRKACEFLLSKQLPSGGWGESYLSCSNKVYTYLEGKRTNLIQTAWATLALIFAGQADIDAMPIHQGIKVLIDFQMEDGDFPEQEITGIYFKNCVLNYSFYRNIFTIRALGEYQQHFHLGSDV